MRSSRLIPSSVLVAGCMLAPRISHSGTPKADASRLSVKTVGAVCPFSKDEIAPFVRLTASARSSCRIFAVCRKRRILAPMSASPVESLATLDFVGFALLDCALMESVQGAQAPDPIALAAKEFGGVVKLSLALGLSRAAVSNWKRIPAERVLEVERLTGVPRGMLRPDLYPVDSVAPVSNPGAETAFCGGERQAA